MSPRTAIAFVTTSSAATSAITAQKRVALLRLCIFLALLALNAVAGMRKRVEPLERDVVAAVVALPEGLRRAIQAAQRLVDVPEETPFLAREQERLLALHRVGALIRHVERIAAEIAVSFLRRGTECLVVVTQLLQHALPLLEQSFLEVLELLLGHRLRLHRLRCRAI